MRNYLECLDLGTPVSDYSDCLGLGKPVKDCLDELVKVGRPALKERDTTLWVGVPNNTEVDVSCFLSAEAVA